jgi:hypothetical protein
VRIDRRQFRLLGTTRIDRITRWWRGRILLRMFRFARRPAE